jgi:hypothetical protein
LWALRREARVRPPGPPPMIAIRGMVTERYSYFSYRDGVEVI